jgi:5'-AMP-activated protein kinase regulatory gamma subunit
MTPSPSAFVPIVLDSQLEAKKALQCLLNGGYACDVALCLNVVSAPLWNSEKSVSASISDIIHLIQYYRHSSSYGNTVTYVDTFRLEPLRGKHPSWPRFYVRADRVPCSDMEEYTLHLIHQHPNASLYDSAQRLIQTHARRVVA